MDLIIKKYSEITIAIISIIMSIVVLLPLSERLKIITEHQIDKIEIESDEEWIVMDSVPDADIIR